MTDLDHRRHAVERILEDESLTADLVNDAAQSLLDWGVAQAEAIVQQAEELAQEGLSQLNAHLASLRRTIKLIGRQAGEAAPEAQLEQVQALLVEIEMEQNSEAKNGAQSSESGDLA